MTLPPVGTQAVIEVAALAQLFPALERRGYQVVGPTLRDGAVVYDALATLEDLPIGWTDQQQAGQYRLFKGEDRALFGCGVGPQSWKRFLHPAQVCLTALERDGPTLKVLEQPAPPPQAFLGVRACELAAIRVQDRVLLGDQYVDPIYQQRREGVFIAAVNCTRASSNCFCSSMETGPQARSGFDLALTELATPERHIFIAEAGSAVGAEVLAELEHRAATPEELSAAQEALQAAAQTQRLFDTHGLPELLYNSFEHPHWADVAARCLSCANCTMVCPTCFCTTAEDSSDVAGRYADRWRKWDSCFSQSFSYIHGGSVRESAKSRYRQWLTHKLASWVDQFGSFGCVGCGRCITWCPVGIDLTEEVAALRGAQQVNNGQGG